MDKLMDKSLGEELKVRNILISNNVELGLSLGRSGRAVPAV